MIIEKILLKIQDVSGEPIPNYWKKLIKMIGGQL